jgi:hypothetical protein
MLISTTLGGITSGSIKRLIGERPGFRELEQRSSSISRSTHAHGGHLFLVVYSRRVAAPQSRYFKMVFTWHGKELTESLTALVIL